jgi:hypothetical protein
MLDHASKVQDIHRLDLPTLFRATHSSRTPAKPETCWKSIDYWTRFGLKAGLVSH